MSETKHDSLTTSSESPSRRLPGLGFVYLCIVVCAFVLYIYWIFSPAWYNGALATAERAAKQANYIEKIVQDFPADQQATLRKEQLQLYQQAGNRSAARRLLAQLATDSRRQVELLSILMANNPLSSIQTNNVERLLAEEVAANAVSTWSDTLTHAVINFLAARSSLQPASDVLEQLLASTKPLHGVAPQSHRMFGVEPDQWVLGGTPGYILTRQAQDSRLVLTLGVYADASDFPIAVQVNRGDESIEEVLTSADNVQVELAIPANQVELVGITTDKFWSLQSDAREFSVRIVNVEFQ